MGKIDVLNFIVLVRQNVMTPQRHLGQKWQQGAHLAFRQRGEKPVGGMRLVRAGNGWICHPPTPSSAAYRGGRSLGF
jgi:hypothetical protein